MAEVSCAYGKVRFDQQLKKKKKKKKKKEKKRKKTRKEKKKKKKKKRKKDSDDSRTYVAEMHWKEKGHILFVCLFVYFFVALHLTTPK